MAEIYVNHPSSSARLIGRNLFREPTRVSKRRRVEGAACIDDLLRADERGYDAADERAAARGIAVAVAFSLPVWGGIAAALNWLV